MGPNKLDSNTLLKAMALYFVTVGQAKGEQDYDAAIARFATFPVGALTQPDGQVLLKFLRSWAVQYIDTGPAAQLKLVTTLNEAKLLPHIKWAKTADILTYNATTDAVHVEALFEAASVTFTGPGRHTGPSKILHVLFPTLFVPWDSFIRPAYGIDEPPTSKDYARRFLPRMKTLAHQVLGDKVVICNALGRTPTLARALDQFNYMKFSYRSNQQLSVSVTL